LGGQKADGASSDNALVRKAAQDAINYASFEVKNFFAKKGYILEKRVLKSKIIFKISLGSSHKVEAGDKFDIIGKYEITNPITGKSEIEHRIIASGEVSGKIDPESSWVLIDNSNAINSIRLGDMVKFKYERGFFSKLEKLTGNLLGL
jgi:hypothetical protein